MSLTFVIPDVHENIEWADRILAMKAPRDRAVLLGDYFHQFHQDRTRDVCIWLKKLVPRRDITLLLGNHDQAHIGASLGLLDYLCSGYCGTKQVIFEENFPDVYSLIPKLKLYCWVRTKERNRNILLTHAGLHRDLLGTLNPTLALVDGMAAVRRSLRCAQPHPWLMAGIERGGDQLVGGFTWCDWHNFASVPGIQQMCGHTRLKEPNAKCGDWCIDTNQRHYAVIDADAFITFHTA